MLRSRAMGFQIPSSRLPIGDSFVKVLSAIIMLSPECRVGGGDNQ